MSIHRLPDLIIVSLSDLFQNTRTPTRSECSADTSPSATIPASTHQPRSHTCSAVEDGDPWPCQTGLCSLGIYKMPYLYQCNGETPQPLGKQFYFPNRTFQRLERLGGPSSLSYTWAPVMGLGTEQILRTGGMISQDLLPLKMP